MGRPSGAKAPRRRIPELSRNSDPRKVTMRIPDSQLNLFEQRLAAIGVGRRDFLKVVGAMATFGGLGFATTAQAAQPSKPAPGDKLAKDQTFRMGGGGW